MLQPLRHFLWISLLCWFFDACQPSLEELDFFEVKTLIPESGQSVGQLLLRDSISQTGPQGVEEHGFWWSDDQTQTDNPTPQTPRISFGPSNQNGISDTLIDLPDETKIFYFRAYARRGNRLYSAAETQNFSLNLQLNIEEGLTETSNDRIRVTAQVRGLNRLRSFATEHGFVWSEDHPVPSLDTDPVLWRGAIDRDGLFRDSLSNLVPGKKYYIRAFLKTNKAVFFSPVSTLRVKEIWTPAATPFGGQKVWGAFAAAITDRAFMGCGVAGGIPGDGLVSGGAGNELSAIWEISGATQVWHKWDIPMPDPFFHRFNAVAFVLGPHLYVGTGGQDNNQISGELYQFDINTRTFVQKMGNVPSELSRMNAVAFVLNGKAYIGTGNTKSSGINRVLNDFWIFDSSTGLWDRTAPLPAYDATGQPIPVGRRSATAFVIGSRAYITGGFRSSGEGTSDISFALLSDCQAYDPIQRKWLPMQPFPGEPRSDAVAFVVNDRAIVGLGYGRDGGFLNDWWSFDPSAGTLGEWTRIGPYFEPGRADASGFSLQNRGYVFGGRTIKPTNTGYAGFILGDAWHYRRE